MRNIFQRLTRLVRHRLAETHLRKALPHTALQELEQRITQSERSHSGQIRICVEAGLPFSYIWRDATPRERAITLFGKLRVWDTEHNNGVLIYLLLADRAIEIVADRSLERTMNACQWSTLISDMQSAFKGGNFGAGLVCALDRVSQQLQEYFPCAQIPSDIPSDANLPDAPVAQQKGLRRK